MTVFGNTAAEALLLMPQYISDLNLLYSQASIRFEATSKVVDIPLSTGVTLHNGIAIGILTNFPYGSLDNVEVVDASGKWVAPLELQAFRSFVEDPTNSVLSSSPNDIEVLFALSPSEDGFTLIQHRNPDGTEGPETKSYIQGIADTPLYPTEMIEGSEIQPQTGFGHSTILMPDPMAGFLLARDRRLLAHELLHILTIEAHTGGGVSDSIVAPHNLYIGGGRITTSDYLNNMGYTVSSSYENQEEQIRTNPLVH